MSDVKKRYWYLLGYPESLPDDWFDRLVATGLRGCVSPLHDQDIDKEGNFKKPHYHILLCFDNTTTYSNVLSISERVTGLKHVEPRDSVRGSYEYLWHKNNPEKHLYSESDCKPFNGFNISDYIELTSSEVSQAKRQLMEYIIANNILEYADLLESIFNAEDKLLFEVASNNTIFFSNYLRSRSCRYQNWLHSQSSRAQPIKPEV